MFGGPAAVNMIHFINRYPNGSALVFWLVMKKKKEKYLHTIKEQSMLLFASHFVFLFVAESYTGLSKLRIETKN